MVVHKPWLHGSPSTSRSREVGGREGEKEEEESLKKAREFDDFKDGELCSEM